MPPFLREVDAGRLQPEARDVRPAPDGEHHAVDHRRSRRSDSSTQIAVLDLLDRRRPSAGDDLDAAPFHFARADARARRRRSRAGCCRRDRPASPRSRARRRCRRTRPRCSRRPGSGCAAAARRDGTPRSRRSRARGRRSRRRHAARRRWRSGCVLARTRSPVATSRTVCASSSTARLSTISTPARSQRRRCRPLRAARSRDPCWRSASASRRSARGTVQP